MPIKQWAGEVFGPKKAADALRIRRSTTGEPRGEIVALPKGKSAHVIPVAQFVDSRPLPGIGRVLEIAHGSASLAWSWLMTPPSRHSTLWPLERKKLSARPPSGASAECIFGNLSCASCQQKVSDRKADTICCKLAVNSRAYERMLNFGSGH